MRRLAPSICYVRKQGYSRKSRSSWSAISPSRLSLPSRTLGCSTSCANLCSNKLPPPTCSRSSAARRSILRQCSTRWLNRLPASARRTRPLLVDPKAKLIILKRAVGFHLSSSNSSQITLLKLTEVRFRDECCSNVKLFIFPMFWLTPNTPPANVSGVVDTAPFLAFHCCEKERQLAL